jgi:hypothetical protein
MHYGAPAPAFVVLAPQAHQVVDHRLPIRRIQARQCRLGGPEAGGKQSHGFFRRMREVDAKRLLPALQANLRPEALAHHPFVSLKAKGTGHRAEAERNETVMLTKPFAVQLAKSQIPPQCRKCLTPVKIMARPNRSAASITSASRTDPPG